MNFKSIDQEDIPLLKKWFQLSHVQEQWKEENLQEDLLITKYLKKTNYIVHESSERIGFVQTYQSHEVDGWWDDEPKGTAGIDFFIGDENFLGKGLGKLIISEAVKTLFSRPEIHRVICDPHPNNQRCIRSLKAAGFNYLRNIKTLDGKAAFYHILKFPLLYSNRLILRIATHEDVDNMLQLHLENDFDHFQKWGPELPNGCHERDYWLKKIASDQHQFTSDKSCRFILQDKQDSRLIGTANYTSIERGPFQNCRLGYKIHQNDVGKGLMTEALRVTNSYMFETMQVHRIEANFIPQNISSQKVLEKLNFQFAGTSKNYLKINGQWRDHILSYKNTHLPQLFN